MNSKKIEELAAIKVREKILLTDKLSPYIKDNDKTPVWDGTVLLYKDCEQCNENLVGRVEVQVKGELNNDFNKKTISFSVEIVELNIYKKNGGVIYFVVYINKNDNNLRKIYYETLTPLKIKSYLSGKENQKTLSITLKEFSANKKNIESIFINFHNDSSKQHSFNDESFISLDQLTKRKDIKSIACEILDYPNEDGLPNPIDILFNNDICFYAKFEGSPIPHPIDSNNFNLAVVKQNDTVFTNGKAYNNYVKTILKKDTIILTFGKSISFTFTKESNSWKITYKPTDFLSHRIVDLDFLINALEAKGINFGKDELTIPLSELETNYKIDLDSMRKELELYRKIQHFLYILHITEDLNFGIIENWNELMLYVEGVVDKKPVSFTIENQESFCLNRRKIGNLDILFILQKVENTDDLYYISNYFDGEFFLGYERNGVKYISSVYSAMIPENFNELSNVNFPNMLSSYKPFLERDVNIFESASFDLLNLLFAYDKADKPKQIILDTAKDIAKWILDESDDSLSYNAKLINYLQTIKRERVLNAEEQNQLLDIIGNSDNDIMSKIASYLLLDNQLEANWHFKKLEKSWQDAFKSYPIYKFLKEK